MNRWIVTTAKGVMEDVGAESLTVHASGALLFHNLGGHVLIYAYAPSQWRTVEMEATE